MKLRSARIVITIAGVAALTACSKHADQTAPADDATSTTSNGSTTTPPSDGTIDGDIRLAGVHCHQDFYHSNFPTNRLAFYWTLHNSSSRAVGVEWSLTRTDVATPVASGVVPVAAHFTGGDGHTTYVITYEREVGRHQYLLSIDPANRLHETDEHDNTYLFDVDVPVDPGWQGQKGDDLAFVGDQAHVHDYDPNLGNLDVHFIADNTKATGITNLEWRVRCLSAGIDRTFVVPWVGAKSRFEKSCALTVPPGEYDIELMLDPANRVMEANEANNVRIFHIVEPPPTGG